MAKYIDAEKLKAEIERLRKGHTTREYRDEAALVLDDLEDYIDSLQQEQQWVDLEEALNSLDDAYFDLGGIAVKGATYYLTVEDLKDIARHFYELGKNSK